MLLIQTFSIALMLSAVFSFGFLKCSAAGLTIYMLNLDKMCLLESTIFDLNSTLQSTINYTCFRGKTHGCGFDVMVKLHSIQGCSLREKQRDKELVRFLSQLVQIAKYTQTYTVFIGPPLGGECNFVSNFIDKGTIDKPAYHSLYQVGYCCRLDSLFEFSASLQERWRRSHGCQNIASLSLTVQTHTLVTALHTFLASNHWENIAIVYEVSQLNLHAAILAEIMQLFLSRTAKGLPELNVLTLLSLQWDTDPKIQIEQLRINCEAIILLARPPMAAFFLSAVSNMTPFLDGRIAIIQFDPSSTITYDVLRFWRLVLSHTSGLGAAGQSLFIMSALPAGDGYDTSAEILNSHGLLYNPTLASFLSQNLMVSAASAVAMAIQLTYLNLKANDGVLPSDADLFQPLVEGPVDVPVFPNITFKFSKEADAYFDYHDFYFFSLSPGICNGSLNSSQTPFHEVFELSYVLFWPLKQLSDVQPKIWPNGSYGPKKNYCLRTGCNEYLLWTAPELLREPIRGTIATQKGDVYSFGIILQEILCCSEPFPDCDLSAEDIVEKVRAGDPPFRPEVNGAEIHYFYKNLMQSAWAENSDLRPTFNEISAQIDQFKGGKKTNIIDHMLNMMERYSEDLESQVRERTLEIEQEKSKTEELIAKMLPP
ncbi:unnamed protein product [Schistocephalus solidus]|uniref:guanylate cyclase n=1 Tax=Schistocephalus solidus TaxID=70667 RepID=A0A183T5V4_SCHSO|nr:unnamed protein product [Schistocephalus solidus]